MPANVVSAAYGRGLSAWHNEGVVLPNLMTAAEVMEFVKPPIIRSVPALFKLDGLMHRADGYRLCVADWGEGHAPTAIGQVTKVWKPIQFDAAFRIFDPVVSQIGACYDAAGVLNDGKVFWVLAKLSDPLDLENDKSERFLLFYTSNDGKGSAVVKPTWIRVVCNNTLSLALRSKNSEVRIRHSGDVRYKIQEASSIVGDAFDAFDRGEEVFQEMFTTPVTPADKYRYVEEVFGIDLSKLNEAPTATKNKMNNLAYTIQAGAGAKAFPEQRDTLWGLFNGVTEFVDHRMTTRSGGSRLPSIGFGSGAKLKEKAFKVAETIVNADGTTEEVLVEKREQEGRKNYRATSFQDLLA